MYGPGFIDILILLVARPDLHKEKRNNKNSFTLIFGGPGINRKIARIFNLLIIVLPGPGIRIVIGTRSIIWFNTSLAK